MSGRRSVSTRTATKRALTSDATSGSAYVVRSISWQAWHHAAVIDSSTGFPSRAARANASALQGSQSIMGQLWRVQGAATPPRRTRPDTKFTKSTKITKAKATRRDLCDLCDLRVGRGRDRDIEKVPLVEVL
jgi:hypothetical protein